MGVTFELSLLRHREIPNRLVTRDEMTNTNQTFVISSFVRCCPFGIHFTGNLRVHLLLCIMLSVSFHTSGRLSSRSFVIARQATQRWYSHDGSKPGGSAGLGGGPTTASLSKTTTFWTNAEVWGFLAALSGWTMSLAAISDSFSKGPEVISLPMTSVLVLYSSTFLRWSFVVKPQNLFL
jgi:hypothetical protein